MKTLMENINIILDVKKRLGDILSDNGVSIPVKFDEYPDAISELINSLKNNS